ncbi:AzlD domain-containing protein [Sphingomonas sp. ERG5]|uniref:AzlD domain-containing protein n=1 Tax=Sphingomonas sp. ERG5 TaxID=1381597 RepID=UPI001364C690|nr:AzlD domain-containing protein [Sphingomonas sp. ERG5]
MPGAEMSALAIGMMALATYATRILGAWLVATNQVPDSVRRLLDHLATCTLAAFVVPVVLAGDVALAVGVSAATVAMLIRRSSLLAMAVAVSATALVRLL